VTVRKTITDVHAGPAVSECIDWKEDGY